MMTEESWLTLARKYGVDIEYARHTGVYLWLLFACNHYVRIDGFYAYELLFRARSMLCEECYRKRQELRQDFREESRGV